MSDKTEKEELDYSDLVVQSDLADYSPVKGCMVIKPYGYKIWELIQKELDSRIKEAGYDNAYFPMLIPESFLKKEEDHVEGFAPECAVVTHAGGDKLEEPLVLRPTSETIIYSMYSKWIKSWRDLPYGINQWANVIRWEKRTRLFLRTTEFLWQEGHTAHATAEEADQVAIQMLHVYNDFMTKALALAPVIGQKSESEKFAGAVRTYSLEVLLRDGKILQAGTSHYLGDNFAKAFDIQYQNKDNKLQHVHLTSWGVSTRLIGAIIMGHRDDIGLVLPPNIAPYQIVIVPIYKKNKDEDKKTVMNYCDSLFSELKAQGIRVNVDDREQFSPGYKYNEWEQKGVPVRVHIGLRDIENNVVEIARRDTREKTQDIPQEGLTDRLVNLLIEIQDSLYQRQLSWQQENTFTVNSLEEANEKLNSGNSGFVKFYWDENPEYEKPLKDKAKATMRVASFDDKNNTGSCIFSGKENSPSYYAGRAY